MPFLRLHSGRKNPQRLSAENNNWTLAKTNDSHTLGDVNIMQCEYCGKQVYVTHICPHCKEHYCLEHRDPKAHHCSSYQTLQASNPTPKLVHAKVLKPQRPPERAPEPREIFHKPPTQLKKSTTQFTILDNAKKKMFIASFILVLMEEILRLVGYLKNPPFFAFLDGNVYVKALYQFITPYYASLIVFTLICLTLFVTTKLTSKNEDASPHTNLMKRTISLFIFTIISIIYIVSITNWLFMLAS
jgi:hypothetical protein